MTWGISCEWSPNETVRSTWDHLALCFGAHLYERPKDGLSRVGVGWMTSVPDIRSLAEFGTLVIMSPRKATGVRGYRPLTGFNHPEDAIYVFGSDDDGLSYSDVMGLNKPPVVYIPVPAEGKAREFFAYTAAAIVCYDRIVKAL